MMTKEAEMLALTEARDNFEAIRLILIDHLNEPERSAFWKAVGGRNRAEMAMDNLRAVAGEPVAPIDEEDDDDHDALEYAVGMLRVIVAGKENCTPSQLSAFAQTGLDLVERHRHTSGRDPATIEACAKVVEAEAVGQDSDRPINDATDIAYNAALDHAADAIRALAAPAAQLTEERR